MRKRCEDPNNRRRHHVSQRPSVPPAARLPDLTSMPRPAADHAARHGTVSGAVLRGARLSASLDEADLAGVLGIGESAVRGWERGSTPLASVRLPDLERLQAALNDVGAEPRLVADIEVAIWCDLVIAAIADGEDTSCLMADPMARKPAFSELLAWSVAGVIPARYRPYAAPGPLAAGPS
jgi:transcriptional regulator with XRE-family HTH domain